MRSIAEDDGAGARRWHSQAFGLELEASFRLADLPPRLRRAAGTVTRVVLTDAEEIEAGWDRAAATRILEESAAPARTVDHHGTAGYRLCAAGYGCARISADGRLVRYAPAGGDAWRWQHFLIGWVLPWTSLVRGFEVFHASAVEIAGHAVALIGPSGVGKTSLAVHLVLDGARFLTDDVLAVDRGDDGVLRAHPGSTTAGIRTHERLRLTPEQLRRLGDLRIHDDKSYPTLVGARSPVPLGAIYFITRHGTPAVKPIEALPDLDLSLLLASTFVPSMNAPARLVNVLDVCATMKASVPVFRARVAPDADAATLARRLRAHADAHASSPR